MSLLNWTEQPEFAHLGLDVEESIAGPPMSSALFSPCEQGHDDPYDCRQWDILQPQAPCRRYRYALTRLWRPDYPLFTVVMLNPSTADAFRLDPTVTRCRNFAMRENCGGLIVLNAFALRATDPKTLARVDDPVGPDNDRVLVETMLHAHGPVIVAWGSDAFLRRSGRADRIVATIHTGGIEPLCFGKTDSGHPRHPLYVRGGTPLEPYPNADAYAEAMNRTVT